ncbi:MAG: phosphotransferase family protein [Candidatus Heimdallarchaeota archaeon]
MTFYEEKNPADITVEELLPFVRKFLPDVSQDSINFFYHGTYNVFEIKNEYILRVADRDFRNAHGLDMLLRESKILDFLSYRLPLAVPRILHLNDSSSLPFSIHKKIPGKSLIFETQKLTVNQKVKIAAEIGKFLSKLHTEEIKEDYLERFPKEKKEMVNDQVFLKTFKAKWVYRYIEAKFIAYTHLNRDRQEWLSKIFDEFLHKKENFTFTPKVTHNDFDTSNILVDQKTTQINGIIDFEDCRIGDPAADLLFFDEGPEFMKALLENYEFADQKSLHERMKFYYSRTCAPYLVWGTTHERPGMVEEGLLRIQKNMNMFPLK